MDRGGHECDRLLLGARRSLVVFAKRSLRASSFTIPVAGFELCFALDGPSAFFLVPVLLVCALASIYSLQVWLHIPRDAAEESATHARRVSLLLGMLKRPAAKS
jgi:formate hydrogenlyase subunit 3/multisubunit Na+/H+ antiporter MnhD subunit